MRTIPILMPQLGESIAEATIIRILIEAGGSVEAGSDIFEVETNKATMAVTAPCAGQIGQIVATTQTIPVLTNTVQYFTQTTPYASVTGGEYDIMARGGIGLTSGIPATDDVVVITLQVGTAGNSSWNYYVVPYNLTLPLANWTIRDRMPCDAGRAAIRIGASMILGAGSTAVYSCNNTQFDVVRVL